MFDDNLGHNKATGPTKHTIVTEMELAASLPWVVTQTRHCTGHSYIINIISFRQGPTPCHQSTNDVTPRL